VGGSPENLVWLNPPPGRPVTGERIGMPSAVSLVDAGVSKVHVSVVGMQNFEHHAFYWDGRWAWADLHAPA
jgi:hypothetical protein